MKLNRLLLVSIGCIFFLTTMIQSVANAQELGLVFRSRPNGEFVYRPTNASLTVSPGGTFTEGIQDVTFDSFQAIQSDVVGVWQVTDFSGNVATFEIEALEESDFPDIEILSPLDGQEFESGTFVPIVFEDSASFAFFGFDADPDLIELIPLNGAAILGTLRDGVFSAPVVINAFSQQNNKNFISNVNSSSPDLVVRTGSAFTRQAVAEILYVRPKTFVGDVNRDGIIDLLDIDPFVQLLLSGQFQFEADINGDGVVDLLDVDLFVQLILAGQ